MKHLLTWFLSYLTSVRNYAFHRTLHLSFLFVVVAVSYLEVGLFCNYSIQSLIRNVNWRGFHRNFHRLFRLLFRLSAIFLILITSPCQKQTLLGFSNHYGDWMTENIARKPKKQTCLYRKTSKYRRPGPLSPFYKE